MKTILAAVIFLLPLAAMAEKADALKPVNIDFTGDSHIDQVTQTYTVTGNVVITRGTMTLKSDRAEVKESPEGYKTVILTASPGKLATFRQKRDGGPDLWSDGQAQRIEYDERADVVKLFSNAIVRQLEGSRVSNEVRGAFISYNNRTEVADVRNDASGENKPGNGRSTIILQPHRAPAAPGAAAQPAPAGKQ
jgi:lipopolysaccharide export system protein LptA